MSVMASFGIGEPDLADLEAYLGQMVQFPDDCDGTFAHTQRWLEERGYPANMLSRMQEQGATSDCDVLLNIPPAD